MSGIEIQQALLGYDRGHRLIASSLSIGTKGKHALLQFSDRSIGVKKIPKVGYLTGYPLSEDGMYVLAKTWAAPEMPRPGCIWTHSLLISFTELAQIADPRVLLEQFRRPTEKPGSMGYSTPAIIDTDSGHTLAQIDVNLARELLVRLYVEPDVQVFSAPGNQVEADVTLLAIWGQQWPRLRRSFRFCSLTEGDRSTRDHKFDVQFLESGKYKFEYSEVEDFSDQDMWLELCINDLVNPDQEFRQFVWRAGGDISGGRSRFAELCTLFAEQTQGDEVAGVERTLGYVVHRLPPAEGRLLRSSTIQDAVFLADRLSSDCLMEILPYLDEHAEFLKKRLGGAIARRYWDIDPEVVVGEDAPACLRAESRELILSLDLEDLVGAIKRGGRVAEAVFEERLDVLESRDIWLSEISDLAIETLSRVNDVDQQRAVVCALVAASRTDLVDLVCGRFGATNVLDATMRLSNGARQSTRRFAERAFFLLENKKCFVEMALFEPEYHLDLNLLCRFSEYVSPDVPRCAKEVEVDPWVDGWSRGSGEIGAKKVDRMMIFFVLRAIVEPSAHAASLLSVSLDRLMDRYSSGKLSYENRNRLIGHLVLSDWFDWTFESRLIRTVAMVALRNRFSAVELNCVSKKVRRGKRILRAIIDFDGGREHLREIGLRK